MDYSYLKMSRNMRQNIENVPNVVLSSSGTKHDLIDITPPPSPEKNTYKFAKSGKKKICSGSSISSLKSDIFETSNSDRIQKHFECLLNYNNNTNSVPFEISNETSNNFFDNGNTISTSNPFRHINSSLNNGICYNGNNPFLPLIQNEQNKESNISFYDYCILCSSSSCKAMNFLLYENASEAFSYEQNIELFPSESISTDTDDDSFSIFSSENDYQNQEKNCSTLCDDYDIFEDENEYSERTVPFSSVSIFELPRDNLSLDSDCDWYISSDEETLTENQNSKKINANKQDINVIFEKINTRKTKKQYPKLSVNSKYICTDTQSEYESPKAYYPISEQSFEEERKVENCYRNEIKEVNNSNFNCELNSNIKCNEYGISQRKFEKSTVISNSPTVENTCEVIQDTNNNKYNSNNNQFYQEPFIGSIFIDDLSSSSKSTDSTGNNCAGNEQNNYDSNIINQNCQQTSPSYNNNSNIYNPSAFTIESRTGLVQKINNPIVVGKGKCVPACLSNVYPTIGVGYNFYTQSNMIPQTYNNSYYPISNSINNDYIRSRPCLKNKMTITDFVNRARLAQQAQFRCQA